MKIPNATRHPHTMVMHGDTRIDDYYWLRDDERSSPEVLDYLRQENNYCQQQLAPLKALEETLYQEMVARIPPKDHSVPYLKNGFLYQQRFEAGGEYPLWYRAPETTQGEPSWQCLIDCNKRAETHPFYTIPT